MFKASTTPSLSPRSERRLNIVSYFIILHVNIGSSNENLRYLVLDLFLDKFFSRDNEIFAKNLVRFKFFFDFNKCVFFASIHSFSLRKSGLLYFFF